MSAPPPLAVSTAAPEFSVWHNIGQGTFRRNVQNLQKASGGVPGDARVYKWPSEDVDMNTSTNHIYTLPLEIEQRLADDLAFIAASKKEAKAVSAVALEEGADNEGLVIRLTSNGTIQKEVLRSFGEISEILQEGAKRHMHRKACRDRLFDSVIQLNRSCLHGRFQSKYWEVPRNRGGPHGRGERPAPLHERLRSSAQILGRNGTATFRSEIDGLCALIGQADECALGTDEELKLLKTIVKRCHAFCHRDGRPIEETAAFYGLKKQQALQDKSLRQVNKIGRYWGLCEDLTQASKKYGRLFKTVNLQTVPRYQAYTPTSLTAAGRVTYYVHAEIQLIIFYDTYPALDTRGPRVLGVSKAACYLCNLFILRHGQFKITKTHGTLYHQWNVPDLASYITAQLLEYRRILAEMNSIVRNSIIRESQRPWNRQFQMESFVHLPARFLTPSLSSDAGSARPANISDQKTVVAESMRQSMGHMSTETRRITVSSATNNDPRSCINPPDNRALPIESSHSTSSTSIAKKPSTKPLSAQPHPPGANTVTYSSASAPSPTKPSPTEIPSVSTDSLQTITSAGAQLSDPTPPSLSARTPPSPHSTMDSWQYPVHEPISPLHPLHTRTARLSLTIEIDPQARGEVLIEDTLENKQTAHGHVIDVSTLPVGEEQHLTRESGDEDVTLILCHGNAHSPGQAQEQATRVTLRWIT